jgi:hypothetical protein
VTMLTGAERRLEPNQLLAWAYTQAEPLLRLPRRVASALLARVHDLRWIAAVGFVLAFVLGLYMIWKIIRTPGEL